MTLFYALDCLHFKKDTKDTKLKNPVQVLPEAWFFIISSASGLSLLLKYSPGRF